MTVQQNFAAEPAYAGNWHIGSGLALGGIDRVSDLIIVGETGVNDWFGNGSLLRAATMDPWTGSADDPGVPDDYGLRCTQQYRITDNYVRNRGRAAWAIDWRHNDGANFAYADGHAKWSRRGSLKPTSFYPGAVPDFVAAAPACPAN